jgi:hypothetical protein
MLDGQIHRHQRLSTVKLSPETVEGYQSLSATGHKPYHWTESENRFLVARLFAIRCCVALHTEVAAKRVAARNEIAGVIGVPITSRSTLLSISPRRRSVVSEPARHPPR